MPFGVIVEEIAFSEQALVGRPVHAAVLGRIFTSWSLIESSITSLLGLMMHNDHPVALAILETFKNNNSRVQAVRRIGKKVLDASLLEDFDALMKDVLAYATERNDIAHSLWGSCKDEPAIVYRMPMEVFSMHIIQLANQDDSNINVDALVNSFKAKMTSFSVDELEKIEHKGRDLLKRVMQEATKKAYLRSLES